MRKSAFGQLTTWPPCGQRSRDRAAVPTSRLPRDSLRAERHPANSRQSAVVNRSTLPACSRPSATGSRCRTAACDGETLWYSQSLRFRAAFRALRAAVVRRGLGLVVIIEAGGDDEDRKTSDSEDHNEQKDHCERNKEGSEHYDALRCSLATTCP